MTTDTDTPAPALPPELAQLEAVALAADAAIDQAAQPPGAEPVPERDPAAELAGLAGLVVKLAGKWQPLVPKFYTDDVLTEAATAYCELAEKHGWTWHKDAGSPEVRLAGSLVVPGLLLLLAMREEREAKREAAKPANRGERIVSASDQVAGGMPVPQAPRGS